MSRWSWLALSDGQEPSTTNNRVNLHVQHHASCSAQSMNQIPQVIMYSPSGPQSGSEQTKELLWVATVLKKHRTFAAPTHAECCHAVIFPIQLHLLWTLLYIYTTHCISLAPTPPSLLLLLTSSNNNNTTNTTTTNTTATTT